MTASSVAIVATGLPLKKISCKRQQLFLVFSRLYFLCPSTSRMNGIPRRALLQVTALAGVVITEPI